MVLTIHHLLTFFLPFILQLCLTKSQTHRNITLGSSLSAANNSSPWLSPSGDFAFGFHYLGDGFLLGVSFDKIPEKTIVWSANGGNVVPGGSKVELVNTGQLLLTDPEGREVWRSEPRRSNVSYAAMLNSGNFVLVDRNLATVWGSFDSSTDTILPSQILDEGRTLNAKRTESNYTNGRFQMLVQSDGKILAYLTPYVNQSSWETNATGTSSRLVFDNMGNIYVSPRNGSQSVNLSSSGAAPTDEFYHRAVLDFDGVFRHYVYPRSRQTNNTRWSQSWSTMWFEPPNICTVRKGNDGVTGSGICGYNSYCSLDNNQRPTCDCPPGFTQMDTANLFGGCKPVSVSQSCSEGSNDPSLFDLQELNNTDWPRSDSDFFQNQNEDWCKTNCLSNCLCHVAVFRDGTCWFKRSPLSNGMMNSSLGGKALIKVRRDGFLTPSSVCFERKKGPSSLLLILIVLLGASCCLNFLISFCTFGSYRGKTKRVQQNRIPTGMSLRSFTYKELEDATNVFKEELGGGASAVVYRGVLDSDEKKLVAVKKLEMVGGTEEEFLREVNAIGQTNHKNLVQLYGFCNEASHRLLVYEFMSNGSLATFLFANPKPNWMQRTRIALGIARGLMYLHEECSSQIIHCDIKPQNILLDDLFIARISDFGLAKLLKADQSQTTTRVRGTKGYVAPEWFKGMPITAKVDVYSFGVMLLEIVSCRKKYESSGKDEQTMILTDWAYDCYKEGNLEMLLEANDDAADDLEKVEKLVMIAIWCIQEDPSLRPTMKKVTQMMEGAAKVSSPPDPSSFISSISFI